MVYGEFVQTPQVRYAEYLSQFLAPSLNRTYFVNSGSEAVEGALKLAKRFTGRSRIISFRNGYHGSTHGALSVQGSETYKQNFRPLLPDTWLIGFNDDDALNAIDSRTACIIAEPIQGEAGVILPENGFLQKLRRRCSETGALLIFDEVQTGFGRTGTMFAIDRYRVVPDILVLAKALGGGMPLGAFISSDEIMESLMSYPAFGHITTFGGHPVCCAAGLASMKVLTDENLVDQCSRKSALFKGELQHKAVTGIRGEGLLLAITLTDPKLVTYAISKAPEYGLILDYFLFCNNALRIAPPLTISDEEIKWACSRLKLLLDRAVENI